MAYNPYAVAQSLSQLQQSGIQAKQQGKLASQKVGIQKEKMTEQYMRDIKEAERKAQEALSKRYKGKKGLGFLGSLIGAFNPIAGGVIGGLTGMSEARRRGKHMVGQAEVAKEAAMNIDPRWKGTFLGKGEGGASDFLSTAEDYYGDIVSKYRQAKPSGLGLLAKGLESGLSSYTTGKSLQGIGKGMGAAKGIGGTEFASPMVDPTSTVGDVFGPLPEGASKFPGFAVPSALAKQYGVSEDLISKLLGAKSPGGRALWEGLKGAGGVFGKTDPLKDEGGWIKGLLAMLQSGGLE